MELSNSITDEICHGFLAMGLTPMATAPDETEDLAMARVPFAKRWTRRWPATCRTP
jgi:hypothetical protein